MTINLDSPGALPALARKIKADIDAYCVQKWNEGPRSHLGASVIGHDCCKNLWFSFRWIHHTVHSGQQYRLFQRGHFEEPRFVDYLEGIGCTVKMFDKVLLYHPESDSYFYGNMETDNTDGHVVEVDGIPTHELEAEKRGVSLDKGKRQIRISACQGHFGGSIDGMCTLPTSYGIEQDVIFLDEFKTQGLGKKFKNFIELVAKGMKSKKAQHFAQMSIYGYKLGIQYGIYMAVNKNDDDLHIEVVKLDWALGEALERKANMIIFSQTPPSGISASPAFFSCVHCDHLQQCFHGGKVDVNCRSCRNAFPIDNAEWKCEHWDAIIPKDAIPNACDMWVSII